MKLKLFLLIFLCFPPFTIKADSPLTSTPFHDAYTDVDIVLKAEQLGVMNSEFAEYLHNESNPVEVKAALINALGWDFNGKLNSEIYCNEIHKRAIDRSDISGLNTNELFVIGYLKAMDNYLDPKTSLSFLKQARKKNDESYTVAIIEALVKAQIAMEKDFCKVWKYGNKVFSNKDLDKDMRSAGIKIIYDYIAIYKNDCK
ncbi:MAG: hypothetical protein SGI89_15990 [bacterium]|nr:hypothetical protein [bacterium]